jgi:hypothetical protein
VQKIQKKPKSLRPTSDDQRKYSRFDVRLSSFVTAVPDETAPDTLWYRRRSKEHPALITDLSAAGLQFISTSSYAVGTQVWVSFQLNGKTYPVRGMVRRQSSYLRDGKTIYSHGIQLLRSDFALEGVRAIMEYLEHMLGK